METVVLNADVRTADENLKKMRRDMIIPAVVYGKTQEPISIKMTNSDLLRAYRTAGESMIIDLKVGKKDMEVLFHKIQREPVSGAFQHIDFYAVTRWEKVHTKVAINFVGEAPAAREGAIIEELNKEVEVKCLPRFLVENFEVDLSQLVSFGDSVKVSDLALNPEEYEVLSSDDDILVVATQPAKMEDLDAPIEDVPVTWADEPGEGEEGWEEAAEEA